MLITRLHVTTFVFFTFSLWALSLLFYGVEISFEYSKPFATVVGALMFFWVIFEKYLWRISLLQGWYVKRPNLRGTWRAEIFSEWEDPETGSKVGPIGCYLSIEQTLTTLKMYLMTTESTSTLISGSIRKSEKGAGFEITGVYINKPKPERRVNSPMHLGSILLETHGPDSYPDSMSGEYWTDRPSKGEIRLKQRISPIYTHYDDAVLADWPD